MEDVAPTAFKTPDFDDNLNNNNINNNLNNNNNNNLNNLGNNDIPKFMKSKEFKLLYQNKSFKITIGLTSNKQYIYIQINEHDNALYYFEIKLNFNELQKFDKIFKACEDLEEAYESVILIFNNGKTLIKEINRNKLTISIFILNLDRLFMKKN